MPNTFINFAFYDDENSLLAFIIEVLFGDIFEGFLESFTEVVVSIFSVLTNIGKRFFELSLDIIEEGVSYSGNLTFGIAQGITTIAISLAFLILVYGFVVENLDFHTYDGWDRVIRFLIRLVFIVPLIFAFGYSSNLGVIGETLAELRANLSNFIMNGIEIVTEEGTYNLSNIADFYFPDVTFDRNTFASFESLYNILTDASGGFLLLGGVDTAISIGIFGTLIVKIVCVAVFAVLGFLVLRRGMKLFMMVFPVVIEIFVLQLFMPIAIAFFASHATQHVAQSYLRRYLSVGLIGALYVVVAVIFIYFAPFTNLSDVFEGVSLGIFEAAFSEGKTDTFFIIGTVLLRLSILEQLWNRVENISSKIIGA